MLVLATAVLLPGCDQAQAEPQDVGVASPAASAPVHVDSIIPIDEAIRRFRERVGRRVERLDGGAASRNELVQKFIAAIEHADTAAFAALSLDAAGFIDLYYPHTQYTAPPYELAPDILWLLLSQNSEKGLVRILRRFAGHPVTYRSYACGEARSEGPNRLWDDCRIDAALEGHDGPIRLFGSIIERDGRFAFVGYANDL